MSRLVYFLRIATASSRLFGSQSHACARDHAGNPPAAIVLRRPLLVDGVVAGGIRGLETGEAIEIGQVLLKRALRRRLIEHRDRDRPGLQGRALTASLRQANTPGAGDPAEQAQPKNLFDLTHRKPLLGHRFAPLGKRAKGDGQKDLRRGLRASEEIDNPYMTSRSRIMAESIPDRP